jgi:hypothetical protein
MKRFLLAVSLWAFSGAALAQTADDVDNSYPRVSPMLVVPSNNHLSIRAAHNLDFSYCNPAPGSRCEPATGWFRDSLRSYYVGYSSAGFLTPGAATIAMPFGGVANSFGAFGQCVSAANYLGLSFVLDGYIAGQGIYGGWAGLWVRADDAYGNTLALDNMSDRGYQASFGYTAAAAGVYIPFSATQICYGGLLSGNGSAYFDDFSIRIYR